MKKTFKDFTINVERNWFTCKTIVKLDDGQKIYRCLLKVGNEKEVINDMIWKLGNQPTFEEAKEYFYNHNERL